MTYQNQGYQQGYQQPQGGYQQQGDGAEGVDQGTITSIYDNTADGRGWAFLLDNDKSRRYSTKHPPKEKGTIVQVQYVQRGNGRYVRKLTTVAGAAPGGYQQPQQGGYQPPQGGYQQALQSGGGNRSSSKADGARVGNALNNAATILGPGSSLADLERTAFAILDIASRLETGDRSNIGAPAQPAPQQQPAPAQQAPQGGYQQPPQQDQGVGTQGFDDNIPF